jgi:zinc finger protein
VRRVIRAPCPLCEKEIEYLYKTEKIPYFSDILIIRATCDCGFRYIDTMILAEGMPVRWILRVKDADDLETKVVRSTTGSIRIPELGLMVEPGPASEAFITNVEGVLARFENIVDRLLTWADEEERKRALEVKEDLRKARDGLVPFTLIVEDPDGNSAIISQKAEKETPENEQAAE